MTGPKILHVIDTFDPSAGGAVEWVRQFTNHVTTNGGVCVVASTDAPSYARKNRWLAECVQLGPSRTFYRYSGRFRGWIRDNAPRFDAVVVHGIWRYPSYGVYLALKGQKVPYFVMLHGMLDPWFNQQHRLKYLRKNIFWRFTESAVIEHARAVIHTCQEELRLAHKSFKPYLPGGEMIAGLGTAVDLSRAAAGPPEVIATAVSDRPYYLYLSRLHPKKGCDLLIQAFLKADVRGRHLVIAGPDEVGWRSQLEALSAGLGGKGTVHFVGPLYGDDKWRAVKSAELFVLPSHQEAFPVSLLEALACGTVVLTTMGVNVWRELKDSGAAFVCDASVASIKDELERFVRLDPESVAELSSRALRSYEDQFEISKAASNHLSLIAQHI